LKLTLKYLLFFLTISSFLFSNKSCKNHKSVSITLKENNDSIYSIINKSGKSNLTISQKQKLLSKANLLIKKKGTDSITIKQLIAIATQYLKLNDTNNFKKINEDVRKLAIEYKDTMILAKTHYNYANFYKKKIDYPKAYYHYNKANNYYKAIDNTFLSAKMLYRMSLIKGHFNDYIGSEKLIIQAISKFESIDENKYLSGCYNQLAILQKEQKEYDKAILYYNKSLQYLNKVENKKEYYEGILNNIGNVYHKMGNYDEAIRNFNEALKDVNLKHNKIILYARLIDNRAYSKLLKKDTTHVKRDLSEALRIREETNNKSGIIINKIHLSKYYEFLKDSAKALKYAKEANLLAKETNYSRDYLKSLKMLANLDDINVGYYLNKYIAYHDSLLDVERKTSNKFAKISFETDKYIEKNKRLSEQNKWILLIGFSGLIISLLLFFLKNQKSKNQKLLFEQQQRKSNEQIYRLTIKQQAKLEREKFKERNRISEELHDGILGRLFGIRIGLGFIAVKDDEKTYQSYLTKLQNIEKDIRNISHELSDSIDFSNIGFITLVRNMIKNKKKIGGFNYVLKVDDDINWEQLDNITKVNLFNIIQETFQNIVKHAKANNVSISFSIKEDNFILYIEDDGVGFNEKERYKKGIGLKNIKSRTNTINGVLNIKSKKNKGTSMQISIPLNC